MAIPFAKTMTALVAADKKEREIRDILYGFAKVINRKKAYAIMRDYDDRMQDNPTASPTDTFMSCLPDCRISADLYIVKAKPTILQLLKSDYKKCVDILPIMAKFAASASKNNEAIVLFNVSKAGLFVATNMTLNKAPVPRIVIHPTGSGISEIHIMTMDSFEQEYALNFNNL